MNAVPERACEGMSLKTIIARAGRDSSDAFYDVAEHVPLLIATKGCVSSERDSRNLCPESPLPHSPYELKLVARIVTRCGESYRCIGTWLACVFAPESANPLSISSPSSFLVPCVPA